MKNIIKTVITILTILLFTVTAYAGWDVTFYHTDPAGTPLAISDSSGNVVWKADYKPFGEEQIVTAATENYKMFVGKEKDKETGLYYFGARYMQDRNARFVSVDSVGPVDEKTGKVNEKMLLNPQKLNRYSYAINNPYRYIDPDGNAVWDLADIGFFAHSTYKMIAEPSWSNAGNLALDAVGLLPLVPSLGTIKRVGEGVDAAVDAAKVVSKYEDVTAAASRFPNRVVDVTKAQFEKNLLDAGWKRSISKDGKVTMLENDGARYVLRDRATSTGGPTADFYKKGSQSIDVKIRLKEQTHE